MVSTLHPPPEVIASWPKPNYINPENHGPGLVVLSLVLLTVAIVAVIVRLYSRFSLTRAPGIDDALIFISVLVASVTTALTIVGNLEFYNGNHIWDVPYSTFVPHRLNVWLIQIAFTISLSSTKISVLLFYRRLSAPATDRFVIAVWIGVIYNVCYCLSFVLLLCFSCRPLWAYWDSFDIIWASSHDFYCVREELTEPLSAAFSSIGDIYSTILPLILVSGLQMPKKKKNALYGLFSLAFIVVGIGIIRMVLIYEMMNVTFDFTWELWWVWVFCQIEMYLAIYIASAPALKPVFSKNTRSQLSSGRSSPYKSSSLGPTRPIIRHLPVMSSAVVQHGRPSFTAERYFTVSHNDKFVKFHDIRPATYTTTVESVNSPKQSRKSSITWLPTSVWYNNSTHVSQV